MRKKTHCKYGHEIAVVGRGKTGVCKACRRVGGAMWKRRTKTDPAKHRRYWLKSKWNMTPEEFDQLFEAQGRVCAFCLKVPKGLIHIDHDHQTGKIRGLLCHYCNRVRVGAHTIHTAMRLVAYLGLLGK